MVTFLIVIKILDFFKAVQYAGKHQLCKKNLLFLSQCNWASSTEFSVLLMCSGYSARAVTLLDTGVAGLGTQRSESSRLFWEYTKHECRA